MKMNALMAFFLLIFSSVINASAAEIRSSESFGSTSINNDPAAGRCLIARISLRGDIKVGDYESIKSVVSDINRRTKNSNDSCLFNETSASRLIVLDLESNGGNYAEGWKISQFLEENEVSTFVGNGHSCLSACAVAFLGGTVPGVEGSKFIRRVIAPKAKLGFHAPFPQLPEQNYSRDSVELAFSEAFRVNADFMRATRVLGIPAEFVPDLLLPEKAKFFMIDTVYRTMMFNIEVSLAGNFSFVDYLESSFSSLSFEHIKNICRNNFAVKSRLHIGPSEIESIDQDLVALKLQGFGRFSKITNEFGFLSKNASVFMIPVAAAAEGSFEMCLFVATRAPVVPGSNMQPLIKASCRGFEVFQNYREAELDLKTKSYVYAPGCSYYLPVHSVRGETRLEDISTELQILSRQKSLL